MTGDRVTSSYLGFPLLIGETCVQVQHPLTCRPLAELPSMKQARLFVKGFRREARRAA